MVNKYRGRVMSGVRNRGEWVVGNLVINTSSVSICTPSPQPGARRFYKVHPETVSKCVGVVDKNKTYMFVGDILKIESTKGICYGVIEEEFGGNSNTIISQVYINVFNDNYDEKELIPSKIEVIGNIFYNFDLLQEIKESANG